MQNHFYKIFFSTFLFCSYLSFAQMNLVPNPSFEIRSSCPNNLGQLYKAIGWINFQSSPDLLSGCSSSSSGASVPNNYEGFQYAASGNSFTSMAMYSKSGQMASVIIREWIGAQLIAPLVKNTKYFISMKISPGFVAQGFNAFTNNMSLLFTNYKLDSMKAQVLNKSHLRCNSVITDTTNWTTVKGSFVADSNYTNFVIGNLYDDSNTTVDTTIAYQNNYFIEYAYSFIDDICVSTDSAFAYNYTYAEIKVNKLNTEISVYPNPCNDFVLIESPIYGEKEISILNIIGEEQFFIRTKALKTRINTNEFEAGIYFLKIKASIEEYICKVIINH